MGESVLICSYKQTLAKFFILHPLSHLFLKLRRDMRGICGVGKLLDTHRWLFLEHADLMLVCLEVVVLITTKAST